MSFNPYEAPQMDQRAVGVLSGKREDLRRVAFYQKGILICILIYLGAVFGQFALPQDVRLLLGLAVLGVGLTGAAFSFLLAMKTYGTGLGILLGILCLVPLLGLLILLMINGKATTVLRQNGIKVGLLGANLSTI